MAQVNMSCIKSLPELCRLGIARVGIRTLLLVLFTYVTQHTAVLLGNSSTLNKRGENPPRCNRTTPADFSLANPAVNAQTIFSFSAVMAFHEALKSEYQQRGSHRRLGNAHGAREDPEEVSFRRARNAPWAALAGLHPAAQSVWTHNVRPARKTGCHALGLKAVKTPSHRL